MKTCNLPVLTLCFTLLFSLQAFGQLELPALFSDHMVLQQQTEASIWGTAPPKGAVEIDASWMDQVIRIKANKEGQWKTTDIQSWRPLRTHHSLRK